MANTTNFGWTTPDDTDLVKDGAAAIRTLGSAIDTSLVDLKGGTTGQVLAKASNTDMDFTWATDASGIPATIFDAKGDLIAASAADTAARLAVGADGSVLTADSAEATGLKWAAPSGGDYVLLSSTSMNNTINSLTFDNVFSATRNTVVLVIQQLGINPPNQNQVLNLKGRNSNGDFDIANRHWAGRWTIPYSGSATTAVQNNNFLQLTSVTGEAYAWTNAIYTINAKDQSFGVFGQSVSGVKPSGGAGYFQTINGYVNFESYPSATGFRIYSNGANWTWGHIQLYGLAI